MLWHDKDLRGVTYDLLLSAYLINSHLGKEEFKRIVSAFDYDDVEYDDIIYGKGAKKGLPEEEIYYKHIASKAKAIYDLRSSQILTLKEQEQYHLLEEIEIPLSEVLATMEYQGLNVDQKELQIQKIDLSNRLKTIEQTIYDLAGETFNVSSPKQLGEILFERLELPYGKKTKTGYSTNVDVLNQLLGKHPIIEEIMNYRQLSKLYSTYIEGLRTKYL